MEAAITWAILWGCSALFLSPVMWWVGGLLGALVGVTFNNETAGAIAAIVLGLLTSVAWFALSVFHCVQSIVTAVNLA